MVADAVPLQQCPEGNREYNEPQEVSREHAQVSGGERGEPRAGREGLGRRTVHEERAGLPDEHRSKRGDEGRDPQPEGDHPVEQADAGADRQSDERCKPDGEPIRIELGHQDAAEDVIRADGEVKLTSDHEDSYAQCRDAHLDWNRLQCRLDVGEAVISKGVGPDESIDHTDELEDQEDNEDVEGRLLAAIAASRGLCALFPSSGHCFSG